MRNLLLAAFGATLFGLAFSVSPTAAAPVGPAKIATPDSGVEQARTIRRKKMRRRAARATQRSVGGNAEQSSKRAPSTGKGGVGGAGGGGAN